jgi:hypothetical protein
MFGTSESVSLKSLHLWTVADIQLPEAICIRLVQGIFGGAVGVFRGSIRDVTGEHNVISSGYSLIHRRDKCYKGICHVGFLMGIRRSYWTCKSDSTTHNIANGRSLEVSSRVRPRTSPAHSSVISVSLFYLMTDSANMQNYFKSSHTSYLPSLLVSS